MNANTKIFLGFLVIIVSIYFLLHKKKRNPYRNIDENHKILENFETKTVSGKECLPWKDAVNFTEYGHSRKCRNPEKDVNGSWCYTDSYGNYEYCDSFDPGCMTMKVLEGCFTPDKNGYQIVIYNSQPFNDRYLEIDQIADSVNQIWVLDQSGRFLRTAKKSKYLNFTWDEHINDSFNNYDTGLGVDHVFNITGMGVKMGGFKVKSDTGSSSLAGSEVCYLFLRNNADHRRNRMITCLSSEKINIQGNNEKDYLQIEWKNDDLRSYINLSKKIDITRKDLIISIHKEKMRNTKGILWGDIVLGKNDRGIIGFTSLGNTFPESKFYDSSNFSESEDNDNMRKYTSVSNKNFFSSETLYFIHKIFYRLNQQTVEKNDEAMDIILGYLNGKVDESKLEDGEKNFLKEFRTYLKYRVLLSDDYRFKEGDDFFTYDLKNKDGKLNDYFKEDDLYGLLNSIPIIKYRRFIEDKKVLLENLKNEYDPSFLTSKLDKIDKNLKDVEYLERLNYGNEEGGKENYTPDKICLKNLKYSTRKSENFISSVSLGQQIDGVLNQIKDISLTGKNSLIKKKLKGFKINYNRAMNEFKKELSETETFKLFNEVVDYLAEITEKYDPKKTSQSDKLKYIQENFGITDDTIDSGININSANKKLFYRVILKMMKYYKSHVKDLYHNIFIRVQSLQEKIKNESKITDAKSTYYKIMNSNCHIEKEIYPAPGGAPSEVTHYTRRDFETGESNRFFKITVKGITDLSQDTLKKARDLIKTQKAGEDYFKYFPEDAINPEEASKKMTLYLKNDLYESDYQVSYNDSTLNNLFAYKLVYDIDTGIISEFKPVNSDVSDEYGLPGFYTKTLKYLEQKGFLENALGYKIMVFEDEYKIVMDPSLHSKGNVNDRIENKKKFDSNLNSHIRYFRNNLDWKNHSYWKRSGSNERPDKAMEILREKENNTFNFSRSEETIKLDIINRDELQGKNIYELKTLMKKEDESYFMNYDINYWSGFKNSLYLADKNKGIYGIHFSTNPKTVNRINFNKGRVPKITAFTDSEFTEEIMSGTGTTGATKFHSLFEKIREARDNYAHKIVDIFVKTNNENIQDLTQKTQGYINNQKILIAEKIKGSLEQIDYYLKPNPLQNINSVDKNLQESLENLEKLQKPFSTLSTFDATKKSCTYTYTEIVKPPAPEPRDIDEEIKNRTNKIKVINGEEQYHEIKQYFGLDIEDSDDFKVDDEDIEANTPETDRYYPNDSYDSSGWRWSNLLPCYWNGNSGNFHYARAKGRNPRLDGVIDMKSPNGELVYFTGIRTLGRADHANEYMKKFDIYYSTKKDPDRKPVGRNAEPHSDWIRIIKDAQGNKDGYFKGTTKTKDARYNLNTVTFKGTEDENGNQLEEKYLGRYLRIIGRVDNAYKHVNIRCDYNFKYAYKNNLKEYKINIEPGLEPIEALTTFSLRKIPENSEPYDGRYDSTDSLVGPHRVTGGQKNGYHSHKSEKGRWKTEIIMESLKPVLFSGLRIQNRGNYSRHACKKFNVYCSMDGINYNKVVSERRIKFERDDKIWTKWWNDDFYEDEQVNFKSDKYHGKYGKRGNLDIEAVIVKPLTKIIRYVVQLMEDTIVRYQHGDRVEGDICYCNANEITRRKDDTPPNEGKVNKEHTNDFERGRDLSDNEDVWFVSYANMRHKWLKGKINRKYDEYEGTENQPAGYLVNYTKKRDGGDGIRRVLLAENVSIRDTAAIKTISWDTEEFNSDGKKWYEHLPVYGKYIKMEAYEPTHPDNHTTYRCDYNYHDAYNPDDEKIDKTGYEGIKNYCEGKLKENSKEKNYCIIYNPYFKLAINDYANESGHLRCDRINKLYDCDEKFIFEVEEETHGSVKGFSFKNLKTKKFLTIETVKNGIYNNKDYKPRDINSSTHLFYSDDSTVGEKRNRLFELVKYQRTIKHLNPDDKGELLDGYINDLELVAINGRASSDNNNIRDQDDKQMLMLHTNKYMYHRGTSWNRGPKKATEDTPQHFTYEGFVIIPMEKTKNFGKTKDLFRRKFFNVNPFKELTYNIKINKSYEKKEIRVHEDRNGLLRIINEQGNFVDHGGNLLDGKFNYLKKKGNMRQFGKPDDYVIEEVSLEYSEEYLDHMKKMSAPSSTPLDYLEETSYNSPSPGEERNCFQDFVSQEVINIDKITEILKEIEKAGKHKTYIFNLNLEEIEKGKIDKDTYKPSFKESDSVLPEVAQFLSDMQILLSSIKRNEELLRHSSTFFYELDDLIDYENHNNNFTIQQWDNINNILHLFFDKAILSTASPPSITDGMGKRIIDRSDDHMVINKDNFTVNSYLYDIQRIKSLFYPSLNLFITREKFEEAEKELAGSENDCGVYYKNKEILDTLERKEFFLKDLFATFSNNDENIIVPLFSQSSNFNFNPRGSDIALLFKSCGTLKRNYITRYMINNVRDSLPVLESGRLNPGNVVDDTLKQLSGMDEDLSFDIDSFMIRVYENYESIKNNYNTAESLLFNVLHDTNKNYTRVTNYLDKKKYKIPKLLFDIKKEFNDEYNKDTISFKAPSISTQELFDRVESDTIRYNSAIYTKAFNSIDSHIKNIKKHLSEISESLVISFPNFKLLEYLNFLDDFEKYKELDIIRKTEVIEECLKIFSEINNYINHNSLELGVIDYNLTNKYLYVDYLFPSKPKDFASEDSSITKYDWKNSIKQIDSLNLVTVRLKRDYIEGLYNSAEIKLKDVIYTTHVGNIDNPPSIGGKIGQLFETDIEGKVESELRVKMNIARKIFKKYKKEYQEYVPLEKNEEYDKLVKLLFFRELKEEIDRHKFVEQGRIFVKQSQEKDDKNKLQIYLKEYDLSKTSVEQLKDYNKYVNINLNGDAADITSTNVRYFHDYSDKKDHPNLFDNQTEGTPEERMVYQINPSSFTSGTSVYGIMNYNFSNSLNNAEEKVKKQLDNVYFKKKVFFQIYGKQLNSTDIGPIDLVNKSELNYILTPEIKYTHGIIFNPDGTIKLNKTGFGALAWFFQRTKEGSFLNIDEWLPYYKTLKAEGMYFLGANPGDLGLDSSRKFPTMFNDYLQSLKNNKMIGKISNDRKKILEGLKGVGSNYDKEKKIEKAYPQIKLDRLMAKKYSNQVFVEAIEFKKENDPVDKKVLALVLDTDDRKEKIKSDYLENKLINQVNYQDKKNSEPFKYEYYKLKMVNKLDLLMNNDFCEASGKKNRYNTLWRYKVIKNFNDYKLLVEGTEVKDEATLRVKGLYDIQDSLKDENYYNMIQVKFQELKNLTLKKTLKKIIEGKKKNMFKGTGYPFMVVYQVRDYEGYICQEGTKNSQKIFLTYELGDNLEFVDKGDSGALNLIDQPKGPIISEEFLSYTGHGATIRFCFQKMKGSTPIETKGVCSSNESDYSPLPGFSDDCAASGGGCGDSVLGLTRLDGTPKCELDDDEVKKKPLGPMDVSIPGNVPLDACDIYKVKGNKRVKYKIGKMFGYNDDGKYQLNNQYTLQYGNYFFRYDAKTKAISLEEEMSTDPNEIGSFAFNVTMSQDKYGPYLLLNPHNGVKDDTGDTTEYLTRVINIFDKHFDAWKVEAKMDKSSSDKNHIRDRLKKTNNLDPQWDNQYYAQKFNLPEDILMKIANEEGIKSELVDQLKGDLEKGNYLFCSLSGPGGGICKGDFNAKPSMTLDEENEILRQQSTQISNLMKRFDNIPHTHFSKFPENEKLLNYMKNTINTIKKAREFVYKRVKDVNWVVKTQLQTNADANKLKSNNKKLSLDNIEEQQPMGDLIDESNIMANAMKDLQQITQDTQTQPKQCRSIEGFDNMISPAPSDEKLNKYERNMSGRYYNYVKDEIGKKKKNISDLNDKIHKLLSQLNNMSDGMDLSGEKKQMLLSEMIQEKNKLEKMIFDIKNYEQQDRIYRINDKLQKVEDIRGEMQEDDFMTKKPEDDINNASVISREDGELLNMYRINKNNNPDHLLFLNGGCLQYDADKKDISIQHCEANLLEQQFNVFRVEDRADMDKFKIRNAEQGMDRPFGIVMTKDNKCLHKENGEISVRNCDNVKNQYWDYSNITGPCNGN